MKEIEQTAREIEIYLHKQPGMSLSAMHLKLALEISASKLFLALGWLLREGRIELDKDEYGVVARCLEVEELTQKTAEV